MDRDVAKLQSIARDLADLGCDLSGRTAPPTAEESVAIGQAFVALSEVVTSVAAALERAAQQAEQLQSASTVRPE